MTEPSPLSEATSDSLDELFRRDPLGLTDSDLDRIIEAMREKRTLWKQSEALKASKPKGSAAAKRELTDDDLF